MDKLELFFHLNNFIFDFSNSLLRILRLPTEIKSRRIRRLNSELMQYRKSERCYVVGLGPSLKQVDFNKLDGDIIATNRYYKYDNDANFKPTFYCIVDKAFFNGNATSDFELILRQYPDTCYILNGQYAPLIQKQFMGLKHDYYAFMWNGAVLSNKEIDFTRILPIANNVVNVGIMLGLYCGYQEIVLLGCDFNSFVSSKAVHCYEDVKNVRLWPMDFELYCYSLVAHSHNELQKYACARDIKIINATRTSLIDSYPFDEKLMDRIYTKSEE